MEVNLVNCLFCALPCSPDFVINKSKTTTSHLAFGGDDEIIEEHLKAVFILRKVLKIPQEVLCQFLVKGNGQFYPELWFNVCESCGESVTQFYTVLKQITKLERQLTTIQTELKGRIEESRAVDNKDFVWVKIREEALKDRSSQVVTEEWRIIVVKTENESSLIGETHHETECHWKCPDDNREKIPNHSHSLDDEIDDATFAANNENTFDNDESDGQSLQPPAAQQSSSSPLTTPDDDDIEDIKFVTDFNPLEFQLPNRNRNHSSSNVSTVPRAKGYFYACQQCSFQCNTKSDFQAHLELHEKGSGAIPCQYCGRPVLPEKMDRHLSVHSVIGTYRQRSRAWKVRKSKPASQSQPSVNGSNETVAEIGTSSSNLSAGKYYYQCKQCPFESNSSVRFDKHVQLHENGSGAVPCEDCGFYLDPTKIGLHRAKRHNYRRDRSANKKKLGVEKKELK